MWVVWCRCLIREINNHRLSSSIYSDGLKLVCVLYLWWSFAGLGHRSVAWCQRSLPTPGGWGGRGSVSTCPTRCGTTGGGRGTARSRSRTNANAERERRVKKDTTVWKPDGRQRSGRFRDVPADGGKCHSRHRRKWRQLILLQHCWLAGCDAQGSCYNRARRTLTSLHLFQGMTIFSSAVIRIAKCSRCWFLK